MSPQSLKPEKRDLIFEATLRVVHRQGLGALTMAQLAKEANLAAGTLYLYFATKEDLLKELYRQVKKDSVAQWLVGFSPDSSFQKNFRVLARNYLNFALEQPERIHFLQQFIRTAMYDETLRHVAEELMKPIHETTHQAGQQRQLKNLAPQLVEAIVAGSIEEFAMRYHRLGWGEKEKDDLIEVLWEALAIQNK